MSRNSLVLILIAVLAGPVVADDSAADGDRVAGLLADLGSAVYVRRATAMEALASLGEAARAALEEAVTSDDLEVRWRARKLLAALDRPAGQATDVVMEDPFAHVRPVFRPRLIELAPEDVERLRQLIEEIREPEIAPRR